MDYRVALQRVIVCVGIGICIVPGFALTGCTSADSNQIKLSEYPTSLSLAYLEADESGADVSLSSGFTRSLAMWGASAESRFGASDRSEMMEIAVEAYYGALAGELSACLRGLAAGRIPASFAREIGHRSGLRAITRYPMCDPGTESARIDEAEFFVGHLVHASTMLGGRDVFETAIRTRSKELSGFPAMVCRIMLGEPGATSDDLPFREKRALQAVTIYWSKVPQRGDPQE